MIRKIIPRDVSWLSFNGRVLQEATAKDGPLLSRIKFLGIFSNNLDEFFRVRVAGLKRALVVDEKEAKNIFFEKPQLILDELNARVIKQQKKFDKAWRDIQKEMARQHVFLKNSESLSDEQKSFVVNYYEDEVDSNIIPLLLDDHRPMPYLRDKSLYLGVAMMKKDWQYETKFAVIEIPTRLMDRFVILPSPVNEVHVILLEDIITYNLPFIFSYFGFDEFQAHAFKITRDAEFDLDNDINTTFADKIAKAVKSRRKGKPTRFVFDKEMDSRLVEFLIKKLNISKKDSIIPGQKIHNFKDFMNFPNVFKKHNNPEERTSFLHPELQGAKVLIGIPNKKVHAKLCIIKKRVDNKTIQYGFVSTGNINEKTAKIYGDHCLMTSNRTIMADINKVFNALRRPKQDLSQTLITGKGLLTCPFDMRKQILAYIDTEISEAKAGRKSHIIIKVNSFSDKILIKKIYEAAEAGVKIDMIVRSIYCAVNLSTFQKPIRAISIVDEYLEHARVMYFYNAGRELTYISSADWMTRNLDHRIEAAVRINDKKLKAELIDILKIQLKDNVKARVLNSALNNAFAHNDKPEFRSQIEIYHYLKGKAIDNKV